MNYYNEFDPKAAAWLRELMANGHIPKGEIDTRSITDVHPSDLRGYTQCHFFAGIGGWSYALQLAGWPDDRPVWTGSCPCQPFSAAGRQMGRHDPRHLWPAFRRLINQCKPPVVFGEQVASAAGRLWLSGVLSDLEIMDYAAAAADLCAAGVGAPHIRQRLYWVADASGERRTGKHALLRPENERRYGAEALPETAGRGAAVGLADAYGRNPSPERQQRGGEYGQRAEDGGAGRLEYASRYGREQRRPESSGRSAVSGCGAVGLGHSDSATQERLRPVGVPLEPEQKTGRSSHADAWSNSIALQCSDGKSRRTEPGIFPLAHGVSGRVGLLRGYGNAIVPQVAAEFIQAFQEADAGAGSGTVIEVDF